MYPVPSCFNNVKNFFLSSGSVPVPVPKTFKNRFRFGYRFQRLVTVRVTVPKAGCGSVFGSNFVGTAVPYLGSAFEQILYSFFSQDKGFL